jgi:hypothetical protein
MLRIDLGGVGRNGQWVTVNSDTSGYRAAPDICADITASAAQLGEYFDPASIDEIRAIHTLEHLPAWDILPTLSYWRTFLKPGGRLLIVVPNLGLMAIHYADSIIPFDVFAAVAYVPASRTKHGPAEEHRAGWDYDTLQADLCRAGYRDVKPAGDSDWPECWTLDYADCLHTGLVGRYEVPNLRIEARA